MPADRDTGLILGMDKAVFESSLRRWRAGPRLPVHLRTERLQSFILSGIYRLIFKVEEMGYQGPLSLEITALRDGFGKKLLCAEHLVRPNG